MNNDQLDLTDIYITLPSTTALLKFFSGVHEISTKVEIEAL